LNLSHSSSSGQRRDAAEPAAKFRKRCGARYSIRTAAESSSRDSASAGEAILETTEPMEQRGGGSGDRNDHLAHPRHDSESMPDEQTPGAKRSDTSTRGISRRECLGRMALAGIAAPFYRWRGNLSAAQARETTEDTYADVFSAEDQALIDEFSQAICLFFWEQVGEKTGMVKDRAFAWGHDTHTVSSIAATGFGLSALVIADARGWRDGEAIRGRVRDTLRYLWEKLTNHHGFFFHFIDMNTGERSFHCEVSSIDTSLLLCGVLTCGEYFEDKEIRHLAQAIYERVDWTWMLNGGSTLSMGWTPEKGFLKARWDVYCELMMIYLLGLGSPTHPLPADSWDAWKRPVFHYEGLTYVGSNAPLFVHQYSQAWFDFRGKRDRYANYFTNSILATLAHKRFCIGLQKKFPDYSEQLWGITASDSAHGYVAWGGPPAMGPIDGSVVPAAAGGSLAFLPRECALVLRTIRERYGKKAWHRYGLVDAFNPLTGWYDRDVLGIDQGIIALMAENARTGFLWKTFMKNAAARRGMERAGFRPE
jgi:hypothetical protein